MPEQLTKHPDVTLEVLRSAGARCGDAGAAAILTTCPSARLCKVPGGELCIYGLADAGRMTQITRGEWLETFSSLAPPPPVASSIDTPALAGGAVGVFALGVVLGVVVSRRLRPRK